MESTAREVNNQISFRIREKLYNSMEGTKIRNSERKLSLLYYTFPNDFYIISTSRKIIENGTKR
jgi:hypothetical protein